MPREWNGLAPFDATAEVVVRHLADQGFLESDGGMLFIGPEAERRFGFRHFMDLTVVFTAPPQFTVLSGRTDIGRTDPPPGSPGAPPRCSPGCATRPPRSSTPPAP